MENNQQKREFKQETFNKPFSATSNNQQQVVNKEVKETTENKQQNSQVKQELIEPEKQNIIVSNESQQKESDLTEEEFQKKFRELITTNNNSNDERPIMERAKELFGVSSLANLMLNPDFMKAYQEEQQKQMISELKQDGKIEAIKESAKKQENRNLRNAAFYNAFKPFFQDFWGIKEAFGLIPMIVTVVIFYTPYLLISLVVTTIQYIFIGVNKIFSAVMEFKKPAKNLCFIVIWTAIAVAVVLGLIYGAQAIFHFKWI